MADRQRINQTYTVVASPAAAAETVIATLAGNVSLFAYETFKLHGWVAATFDTDATGVTLRIRRDSLTGQVVGVPIPNASIVAADVCDIYALDSPSEVANAVYVLTAEVLDANSPSTVTAVYLECRVD